MCKLTGTHLRLANCAVLDEVHPRHVQVDVDLSPEQFAAKVSRQQGRLYLKSDGTFRLTNTGRRKFLVNNTQVAVSEPLPHLRFRKLEIKQVYQYFWAESFGSARALCQSEGYHLCLNGDAASGPAECSPGTAAARDAQATVG